MYRVSTASGGDTMASFRKRRDRERIAAATLDDDELDAMIATIAGMRIESTGAPASRRRTTEAAANELLSQRELDRATRLAARAQRESRAALGSTAPPPPAPIAAPPPTVGERAVDEVRSYATLWTTLVMATLPNTEVTQTRRNDVERTLRRRPSEPDDREPPLEWRMRSEAGTRVYAVDDADRLTSLDPLLGDVRAMMTAAADGARVSLSRADVRNDEPAPPPDAERAAWLTAAFSWIVAGGRDGWAGAATIADVDDSFQTIAIMMAVAPPTLDAMRHFRNALEGQRRAAASRTTRIVPLEWASRDGARLQPATFLKLMMLAPVVARDAVTFGELAAETSRSARAARLDAALRDAADAFGMGDLRWIDAMLADVALVAAAAESEHVGGGIAGDYRHLESPSDAWGIGHRLTYLARMAEARLDAPPEPEARGRARSVESDEEAESSSDEEPLLRRRRTVASDVNPSAMPPPLPELRGTRRAREDDDESPPVYAAQRRRFAAAPLPTPPAATMGRFRDDDDDDDLELPPSRRARRDVLAGGAHRRRRRLM